MPRYKTDKAWGKHQEFCDGVKKVPKELPKPRGGAKVVNVCFAWRDGTCHRGARCRFAHYEPGAEGSGATGDADGASGVVAVVRSCHFFLQGKCRKGMSCPFSHDVVSTPALSAPGATCKVVLLSLEQLLAAIPAQVESVGAQLEGYEFARVQLGVRAHGGSGPPAKRARGAEGAAAAADDASAADGADSSVGVGAGAGASSNKQQVLDGLRAEFARRHPGVEFVSQSPDLMLEFDMATAKFDKPIVVPVFVYGRYNKLVRGIPQSRWPCSACRPGGTNDKMVVEEEGGDEGDGEEASAAVAGIKRKAADAAAEAEVDAAGTDADAVACEPATPPTTTCKACGGTGLQYPHSVQDLLGSKLVAAFDADDCVFHGMGREDIDVLCLGSGRPCVIELKRPCKRRASITPAELEALRTEVNASAAPSVSLKGPLRLSSRAEPARLKVSRHIGREPLATGHEPRVTSYGPTANLTNTAA